MSQFQSCLPRRAGYAARLVLLLTVAGAACLVLAGCNRGQAAGPQGPPTMPVKVKPITSQEINNTSEYVATIKSRNSATIMSDVEGWISEISIHSGQAVKKGQSLLEIDPRRQRASVSSQESQRTAQVAQVQWAKQQLDRSKGLYASGVVARQDLDQAQSAYDAAEANLRSLDAQLSQGQVQLKYYNVFAPTDGIVGDVPVHVGDRVTNTTVLTTIDERRGLEVYIPVPSDRAHDVKLGAPVDVLDAEGNVVLRTKVSFISPQVDQATQSVLVKAPADQAADKLRSLQLVRARITWNTRTGITVPVVAVARVSGQFFAFVADQQDGKTVARQKPVELGEISGNDYTVLSGLKAGDRVIVAGGQSLADGMPIKIEQ